jgi:hypothetical protein
MIKPGVRIRITRGVIPDHPEIQYRSFPEVPFDLERRHKKLSEMDDIRG